MKKNEKGFVLVTTLVLLSVLTLMAAASSYKTVLGIKVSKMSEHLDLSMIAAQTGLTQLYWYWSRDGDVVAGTGGQAEFDNLKAYLDGVGSPPAIYKPGLAINTIADAPSDADLQAADSGFKVFTMTSTGVDDTIGWKSAAAGTNAQVAVWLTTFNNEGAGVYPYKTPIDLQTDSCPGGCRLVTYALGRSGESQKLLRETQSFLDKKLGGVAAMTNAPKGDNFSALCGTTTSSSAFNGTANGSAWPADGSGPAGNGRVLLEVTQAPFVIDDAPSGTALASNTEFGEDSAFGFRRGTSSQTGAVFNHTPLLMYAGHKLRSNANLKVDWASAKRDSATPAPDLPAGMLPKKLVNSPMIAEGERMDYFTDADTNLFNMDAYRWAAEQLTCQDPTKADGAAGNGIYCSKGEKLRRALVKMNFPAYAPVTGRLTLAQFEYNVANSIPMFGMIRLMLPAEVAQSNAATCNGKSITLHRIGNTSKFGGKDYSKLTAKGGPFDSVDSARYTSGDLTKILNSGYNGAIPNPNTDGSADESADGPYAFSDPDGAEVDTDGSLGARARMVVYGSVVIDYFADYDIENEATSAEEAISKSNMVFDPQFGERILTPLESPDVYFWANIPLLINPVMPRFTGTDPYAFPTAADPTRAGSTNALTTAGLVNMRVADGSSVNINLASPYDGNFPWSEGMLRGPAEMNSAGTFRLMSRDFVNDNPSNLGLVKMAKDIGRDTEVSGTTTAMTTMLGWRAPGPGNPKEADIIHYYFDLMRSNVNRAEPMDWPVALWPGNSFGGNFCMGRIDCNTNKVDPSSADVTNNMGDKMHLLFPTGYMHGWKAALAALDINADEWNTILSGNGSSLKGIADAGGLYTQLTNDCSPLVGGCPLGKPYHSSEVGFKTQADVQAIQDMEEEYFYITKDLATGYGIMDSEWLDLPTTIYSGGLIDIHSHTNMNGIMYTPGPLEWGSGIADYGEVRRDGSFNVRFSEYWSSSTRRVNFDGNDDPEMSYANQDALSYVNGSIITGYGMAVGYSDRYQIAESKYLLVYDLQAVDNVNTNMKAIRLRRYDWQQLN